MTAPTDRPSRLRSVLGVAVFYSALLAYLSAGIVLLAIYGSFG